MLPSDRQRVLVEVVHRVRDRFGATPQAVERSIFDTIYEERRRLETDPAGTPEQAARYDRLYREAVGAGPDRQREILHGIIRSFANEVVGHFDPRVYGMATRVLPPAMNVLLNAMSPLKLAATLPGGGGRLDDQVIIGGETEMLKAVAERGTLVLVPTHSSNLDSILVAYALFRLGLPPFTYGAGLNLFSNRLMGFFMHNLGAYKVDRRKKAAVYKDVLKVYAGCTMEAGYHNLFFPGGTRSRSGSVEARLKMGLLGMALDAYVHNLRSGAERPDVFVVPCTINYQLVLEAETLIEDHLKAVGKSRYIIDDDEFSRPRRVIEFVSRLFAMDSRVHIVFGRPLDVFGNHVARDGRSLGPRGRRIDRTRYVRSAGEFVFDPQRDREYVRELADSVTRSYRRNTVVQSVNLVCSVAMSMLRESNPGMDRYRLLRTGGDVASLPAAKAYERIESELAALLRMEGRGQVRLDDRLRSGDVVAVVGEALAHLGTFHRRKALVRRGDRLIHNDRNLLLYYGNRLAGLSEAN